MIENTATASQQIQDPAVSGVLTLDLRNKPMSELLQELERNYISYVLTQSGGNKTKAATLAGMAKDAFHRRCNLYSIQAVFRCA